MGGRVFRRERMEGRGARAGMGELGWEVVWWVEWFVVVYEI